jgi:phage terminase small subunit
MATRFTPKQLKFVELYSGNGTEAARLAGYKGSDNTLAQAARDLLRNPQIKKAIEERQAKKLNPLIASREQRQEFWTAVMRDEEQTMKNRLKASELLGKSEADFTDKVEHSGTVDLADKMKRARERRNKKP